ncbi:MAG: o-succinylbenzoate synthase [Sphingobacteriaceae bacterium]|nr:o-succinylbenzoate synthase [Sphingobacteriaceae bacterium]
MRIPEKLTARCFPYRLDFKQPAGTSRGVLTSKISWMLVLEDENGVQGLGECGPLAGLSFDDRPDFGTRLQRLCEQFNQAEWATFEETLLFYPAMRFGFEMALQDYVQGGKRLLFESDFSLQGAPQAINGLIWMGSADFMKEQIAEKLERGFRCLKLKVGAIDFDAELAILKALRSEFSAQDLELRVDANGAFSPTDALRKLQQLASFDLHSIEQPIKAGQVAAMAQLCAESPLPIALDEELIGLTMAEELEDLLDQVRPPYIILKPTLLGGFEASEQWIAAAEVQGIHWWVTSALESNVGLNAIAQWTATLGNDLPQGLGTGQLYTNNFPSPLHIQGGSLQYLPEEHAWNLTGFKDNL